MRRSLRRRLELRSEDARQKYHERLEEKDPKFIQRFQYEIRSFEDHCLAITLKGKFMFRFDADSAIRRIVKQRNWQLFKCKRNKLEIRDFDNPSICLASQILMATQKEVTSRLQYRYVHETFRDLRLQNLVVVKK